jgi:LuxR family quorum sensing-dependent transcriptional regulator
LAHPEPSDRPGPLHADVTLSATNPTQFYDRLGLETTVVGCSAVFREAIALYGFDTFACGEIDLDDLTLSTFYALDWPERWRRLYLSSGLVHRDPLIEQISRLRRAFTWSELEDDLDLSRIGREALALFREHGWSEGLVVPVSRGGSRFGLVSVAGVAARLTKPEKSALCLMCEYLLSRRRELECIALVAAGKSDARIAAALGITRSTAHEYVESARRRLKSATRAQMIARACFLGLITGA